jgi:hypothetical protein
MSSLGSANLSGISSAVRLSVVASRSPTPSIAVARRAYAEFDRVATLSNDLFEAAMVGGREHDRTDIAKWRDFLRRISPQSEVEIQRQEDDKEAEWHLAQRGLPRETEEERAREDTLLNLELRDEWKDHRSGA